MRNTASKPLTGDDTTIIWDLIANCASAWARFGRAVSLVDEEQAKLDGRKITAADQREYAEANDAEHEAFNALLAYPARKTIAVRAKAHFIRMRVDLGDRLQEDEVDLLLDSMIETRAQRAAS